MSSMKSAIAAISRLYPTSSDVPENRPGEFVRIMRVGGVSADIVIDKAMLSVECWANSTQRADEMADEVYIVLATGEADGIYSASINSKYSSPDPESGQPRCIMTMQIVSRFDF